MTWLRIGRQRKVRPFWFSLHGAVLVIACTVLNLTGCGDGNRPATVSIHGRVTLDNGDWPKDGVLYFLPLEPAAGLPRRAATAKFGTDGNFSTPTSWAEGDGIVPGRYRVYVECWKIRPTRAGPPPVSYADTKYQSGATSDIEVEITPESDGQAFEWNFPSNKI
jgi:hypothetical protein